MVDYPLPTRDHFLIFCQSLDDPPPHECGFLPLSNQSHSHRGYQPPTQSSRPQHEHHPVVPWRLTVTPDPSDDLQDEGEGYKDAGGLESVERYGAGDLGDEDFGDEDFGDGGSGNGGYCRDCAVHP